MKLNAAIIPMLLLLSTQAFAGKANDTVVFTKEEEITTTDFYYANNQGTQFLSVEVCDTLVMRDPSSGAYTPLLATSYQQIDPLTVEFKLRKGVKFHDGKDFSAKDVKYTLDHLTAKDSAIVQDAVVNWIDSTTVVDDLTVRVKSKAPTPMAMEYFANALYVLPEGHYEKAPVRLGRKDYGSVLLNCTGPYKIAEHRPGQYTNLVRNENYFDGPKGKPAISKVQYRTVADKDAQIVQLLSGQSDFVMGIQKDKAAELKAQNRAQILSAPTLRFTFLNFNSSGKGDKKSPIQDVRVRKAISHAVNVQRIVTGLIGEGAAPLASLCHPQQTGCSEDVPRYDYSPDKARELLKEAGFPNGFEIDFYSIFSREIAEAIISDLRAVGVTANLRQMLYTAVRQRIRAGDVQMMFQSWGSNRLQDASASVSYFFGGGEDDLSMDKAITALIKAADVEMNPQARLELYKQALRKASENAYVFPIASLSVFYGASPDLNIKAYFDERPRFYSASWK